MRQLERVLLYFVAFGLATMLIADGLSAPAIDRQAPAVVPHPEVEMFKPVPAATQPVAPASGTETKARRASTVEPRGSLKVVDSAGRVRIELSLNDSDQPQFILRRADGEVMSLLTTDDEGGAKLTLGSQTSGATELSSDREGNQRIELRSASGQSVSMNSRSDGSCDVRLAGSEEKMELVLRRANDNEAEVRIRPANVAQSGVTLAARVDGGASLRLLAKDGLTGPIVSVAEDKTAQVAVNGGTNQSGPSLIRTADGVSIVSARLPNGNPGASMVVSPEGRSVIAVIDEKGRRSAEMRIDEHGVPSIQTHDPDAKPSRTRPKPVEEERRTDGQASYTPP